MRPTRVSLQVVVSSQSCPVIQVPGPFQAWLDLHDLKSCGTPKRAARCAGFIQPIQPLVSYVALYVGRDPTRVRDATISCRSNTHPDGSENQGLF